MTSKKGYVELVAWQRSMDLIERVYRASEQFPNREIYGLTAQMRRAAISIASNIAEGQGRKSHKDFRRHLAISLGTLNELETQIHVARRLNYLEASHAEGLLAQSSQVGQLLNGLSRSLRRLLQA